MRVMFVGDLNLGEYYLSLGHGPASFSARNDVFENVKSIFTLADFVVGNLEAPITDRKVHSENFESETLRVDSDSAQQLKNAGFKMLQIANNHIVQHSDDGFKDTLNTLDELNIFPVGINGHEPCYISNGGQKLGFLAASDVPDNTNPAQTMYQRLDEAFIQHACESAKLCDHLVVMLHWGLEASTTPLPYQRALVDKFYDAGVSAVIGTHPHLFYEIDRREHFVAAYSLGNFVFDLCWDNRMLQTGILDLEFTEHDITANFWPVFIEAEGCLPTPTGEPIMVDSKLVPYDLGNAMNYQQIRKAAYFVSRLHKGNTTLKRSFMIRKTLSQVKAIGKSALQHIGISPT